MLNAIAIIVHLVAINVWAGGMFFIIMVLGKVVATLEIPEQYSFWQHVLNRFFLGMDGGYLLADFRCRDDFILLW